MSHRCKTCGEYPLFPETHRCPPAWEAWWEAWGDPDSDEPAIVYAHDAEEAAERCVEQSDDEPGEETETVWVRPYGDVGMPTKYYVEREYKIDYCALEAGD